MRIFQRANILGYRCTISIGKIETVYGVRSRLPDGKHILMWDFDMKPLTDVYHALYHVWDLHELPTVYIAKSSPKGGLHAYCLDPHPWLASLSIVASTPGVDSNYVKWCAFREHWTLRITEKNGYAPKPLVRIGNGDDDRCPLSDLKEFCKYETWSGKLT